MSSRFLWAVVPALLLGALTAPSQAQSQPQTISGTYSFAVVDPANKGGREGVQDFLQLPGGRRARLDVDPELIVQAGGRRALSGQSVSVVASATSNAKTNVPTRLRVSDFRSGPRAQGLGTNYNQIGSKPYITLLCKFKDVAAEPHPKSWYENLLSDTYPGIGAFYRENSFGQMNLTGSQAVGWLSLPKNESAYVLNPGAPLEEREMDNDLLLADATALFDPQVFFPTFAGINIVVNKEFVLYDLGGPGWPVNIDGQNKAYGVTWLPIVDHEFVSHEMGHSLGMDHSSGPYGQIYDSNWDMMSGDLYNGESAEYGAIGMHTNSYHKDVVGWIPSGRIATVARNTRQTITLERSAQPGSSNFLLAQIPIPNSTTRYYTVEARKFVSFDYNEGYFAQRADGTRILCAVPREGIVLHKVDTTRDFVDHASVVVDGDNNGDVNDDGAAWIPGETFTDSTNTISVQVVSQTATNYTVTITNGTPPAATYSLTGRVFRNGPLQPGQNSNPNDQPGVGRFGIANTTVTLSGAAARTATTDSNGFYTFTSLPAGAYTVTPTKTNFAFEVASRAVTLPTTTGDVVPNGKANFRTFTITATVLRPAGTAFSGVSVRVRSTSPALDRTLVTDAAGVAFFNGLAPGTYTVSVTPPPSFTFATSSKTAVLPTTGTVGVSPNRALNFQSSKTGS